MIQAYRRLVARLGLVVALGAASTAFALDRTQVGIIVNTADPLSVKIGRYYAERRRIPFQNILEISFPPGRPLMTLAEFQAVKLQVDIHAPAQVEAYALTWAAPYRVECMSVTSAFALGFDLGYCATGCRPTRTSPYFNSPVRRPHTQLRIRPTMSIAALSLEQAKALIDRGVRSDRTFPKGTAYLMSTSDKARNVRSAFHQPTAQMLKGRVRVKVLQQDSLRDAQDVLFYFTGRERVDGLDTLGFVPGAMADHLTSFGGALTESTQMSVLRWLEAGATGSYGTVVEPCNLLQKFPHPAIAIGHYLAGETLIEAYWKSVAMPGQGIFVGEPLAAPYARPSP
jgi:uncharacterized protein (TIGR03790 family)